MKYHAAFKFLAFLLCALFLMTAVAGCFGIFAVTELGLYNRSYEDAYRERLELFANSYADSVMSVYASQELGNATREQVDSLYGGWYGGAFDHSKVGYEIRDPEGNAVESQKMDDGQRAVYSFAFPMEGLRYMVMVDTMTREEHQILTGEAVPTEPVYPVDFSGIDNVPEGGALVHEIELTYSDGSGETIAEKEGLGLIWHDSDGQVVFESSQPHILEVSGRSQLQEVRFFSNDLGLLYSAKARENLGLLYTSGDGLVRYEALPPMAEAVPEGTIPDSTELPVFTPGDAIYSVPNRESAPVGYVGEKPIRILNQLTVNDELWFQTDLGWIPQVREEAAEEPVPTPAAQGLVLAQVEVCSAPGENGEVVGTLEPGEIVEFLRYATVAGTRWGQTESGWIPMFAVTTDLVDAAMEEAEAGAGVPIRQTPHADGPIIGYMGTPVWEPIQTRSVGGEGWTLYPEGWVRDAELEDYLSAPAAFEEAVEQTIPEEPSVPAEETVVPTEEAAVPTEESVPPVRETLPEDVRYETYYDHEAGQRMVGAYVYKELPPYTVEVSFAADPFRENQDWFLIKVAYALRDELVPIIAVSAFAFLVFFVYLCCAAGRRPGSAEVRAGGLNRLPLDAYGFGTVFGTVGLVWLGFLGMGYFYGGSPMVALAFMAALSYAAAVLAVGFCFAFAAQVKTPGGFWWRNTLCGWAWKLVALCFGGMLGLVQWMKKHSVPLAVKLWRWTRGVVKAAALWLWRLLGRLWRWLLRACSRTGDMFARFFGLLPLTWQWLLAAGTTLLLVFFAAVERSEGWIVIGFIAALAVILYGSHCFGVLLESARRMGKGDLEQKVDDKLLLGCFRDFAGELNSLADVAVVAAQKQLRSERMKTELITNVSHDIKTPLTSIINYVDLLEKPHTEAEREVYLEVLSRQSQRLKKLIEDLMEMSKASTGNMHVDIGRVDAVEAVNQALGEFADKLDKANLTPLFRGDQEPVYIRADGRLTWRVLSNLLGNAVKYALPGTRLYIDLSRVEEKVVLSLKNISREELNVCADELLERFVRGDASRNTEGSGLGLNIAQSLMELQKGSLQLLVDGDLFKVTLIFPAAE